MIFIPKRDAHTPVCFFALGPPGTNVQHLSENTRVLPMVQNEHNVKHEKNGRHFRQKNEVVCLLEHFVLLALEQAHEHLLRCILPTVNHWSWKCLHIPGATLPWVRSGLQVRVTFFSLHSASYQLWPTSTLRRSSREESKEEGKKVSSSRTVNCKGA